MKIGILTYHRARNVGAVLQAYALQKTLSKIKGKTEIIDYRSNYLEEIYRIKNFSEVKTLKSKIKFILERNKNVKTQKLFCEFNKKNLCLSNKIYNLENIEQLNDIYDIFIVGSDQVWNMNLNGKDNTYLLNFVKNNNKRNSYAASLGGNQIKKENLELIRNELIKFNKISLREYDGKEIIQKLLNKECNVVLDPTLLLNCKEWDKVIEYPEIKEKYIFVYTIASTPNIIKYAKKIAKEKKCKILYFNNGYKKYGGVKNLNCISPEKFLGYIKNAEYVITSSFHGMCFSIIFNKNFYYELDKKKENNNSRLQNLADKLNLADRIINENMHVNYTNIDYNKVNELLKREVDISIEFLESIGEDNNE